VEKNLGQVPKNRAGKLRLLYNFEVAPVSKRSHGGGAEGKLAFLNAHSPTETCAATPPR